MSSPLVDVLIPVLNCEATLRESVQSIQAQTIRDISIIIVDDGSSDETPAILADLAQKDARISVLIQPNRGIVDALNKGLEHCSCEYVARFDADDISFPDRIALQLDFLARYPDCVAVGGKVEHIDERGQIIQGLPQPGQPSLSDPAWAPAREPYIIHPFMLARRTSIVSAGGYRFVHNSEDSDLFWRLSEQGSLHNLEQTIGKYRFRTSSISSASLTSGRIMAVSSQLAALSAQRRRAGGRDLVFERRWLGEYRAANTMDAICGLASQLLDPREAQHLRIASAIKLLELARYRPYEIELSDCTFIRNALACAGHLSQDNQGEVQWYVTVTAARLLRTGHVREAVALAPPATYPVVAARTLLRKW